MSKACFKAQHNALSGRSWFSTKHSARTRRTHSGVCAWRCLRREQEMKTKKKQRAGSALPWSQSGPTPSQEPRAVVGGSGLFTSPPPCFHLFVVRRQLFRRFFAAVRRRQKHVKPSSPMNGIKRRDAVATFSSSPSPIFGRRNGARAHVDQEDYSSYSTSILSSPSQR